MNAPEPKAVAYVLGHTPQELARLERQAAIFERPTRALFERCGIGPGQRVLDLGWVVSRHGALYAEEYGWDGTFEALVAGVAKDFIEKFDPKWEACWMAEIDGRPVGSVCLVKKSATVAKLRLLIVDPAARGHRIGTRLVDEGLQFARRAGYKKVTLWTNSILDAARHHSEQAGFDKEKTSPPERVFGQDLVFETWELTLGPRR